MTRGRRTLWGVLLLLAILATAATLLVRHYPVWLSTEVVRYHLWRAGARSEYVEVDGHRIHFYEALPPHGAPGTPLLLVHGLGARAEDWSPLIPGLAAAGFHVYAVDLLGYGRSDRPDVDYSIALEEQTVVGFLRAVGLSRTDVAGWSMGGWITMKMALDHPEIVDRLVVYDSAGVYFQPSYDFSVFTPEDTAGVDRLLRLLFPKPPAIPAFVMKDALRTLQKNAWVTHRSVAAMTSGRDLLDFRLHTLTPPLLIVWGEQDKLIPLASGQTIHRLVPGSVLAVAPGCGHLAPGQCWKPVLRETLDFLQATPPLRGGEVRLSGQP